MARFFLSRGRADRLAAARRAVRGGDTTPPTRLERDFDALWHDLDRLRDVPFPARDAARRHRRPSAARRVPGIMAARVALLALALAIPLGVSLYRDHVPQSEALHATGSAEQRLTTLADGSTVRLNVESRIEVRWFRGRREVLLHAGEAFFAVALDEARPFLVIAGPVRLRVLGTTFNVRLRGDAVEIAVREGSVAAYGSGDTMLPRASLAPGEAAVFSSAGMRGAVASVAPDAAGAWTEGWIKLDGAPLSRLIEELGRYRRTGIELAPEAAGLRVSGAFRTDDPRGVLEMLPRVLPVKIVETHPGYVIRPAAARAMEPPRYLDTPRN